MKRQQTELASLNEGLTEHCQRIGHELFDRETRVALLESGDSNPSTSSIVGTIIIECAKRCSKLRKKLREICRTLTVMPYLKKRVKEK